MIIPMKIKTLTWNIGGGKFLVGGSDPTLLSSYTTNGLSEIISYLEEKNLDIITLQEVQTNQLAYIAQTLGYKFTVYDITSESHIDKGEKLGNGVISRYPIIKHDTGLFYNPNLEVEWEDGSVAYSFDKGFTRCLIEVEDQAVEVTTLHLIPFRRFKIDIESGVARKILDDVQKKIVSTRHIKLIQGDFNINSETVGEHLPQLFRDGLQEIQIKDPTNPKGRKYDHILFKNLTLLNYSIDSSVLTDHYPVAATFRLDR